MTPHTFRRVGVLAAAATLAATAGTVTAIAAPAAPSTTTGNPNADSRSGAGVDRTSAIVQFSKPSVAETAGGTKIAFGSTKVKNQRAELAQQRNDFRSWLKTNAPTAKVTGDFDVALNAVAVDLGSTALSTLSGGPAVTSVGYENLYTPSAATQVDPDLALVSGEHPADTPSNAGDGVKVGVIDTGIDATHPCFKDAGTKPGDLTNSKVIIAKVFARRAQQQNLTAAAVQDHGTHVAGTIACNTGQTATVNGAAIPYSPSGVAPGALLGNYNVFPGDIEDAPSEDILNALQAAAEDGMDVVNMSLGGGAKGTQDLLTHAIDNLDRAGMVVAVAAGNSGPGHYTVESPGSAERALTAGASSVGHYVGLPVTSSTGTTLSTTATGDFAYPTTAPLSGVLTPQAGTTKTPGGTVQPFGDGCTAGGYDGAPKDFIALVSRGTCTFGNKVANAQAAGARATIVVNNVPGDPIAMATDEAFPTTIVAVNAPFEDSAALSGQKGSAVTIGNQPAYKRTTNDLIMGSFSSQGPTDVSFRVKPDAVAPGVNVLSSIPQSFCTDQASKDTGCWAFFQGTSMATPHLAGIAAVVKWQHSGWTSEQIRSAIVNTADPSGLRQSTAIDKPETDPLVIGAGQADVLRSIGAKVALSSVSTSFGSTPAGAGKSLTESLTVTNISDGPVSGPVSVTGAEAKLFKASVSSISLAKGASTTFTVSFAPAKGTAGGDHSASLQIGNVAHSVLYAFVK